MKSTELTLSLVPRIIAASLVFKLFALQQHNVVASAGGQGVRITCVEKVRQLEDGHFLVTFAQGKRFIFGGTSYNGVGSTIFTGGGTRETLFMYECDVDIEYSVQVSDICETPSLKHPILSQLTWEKLLDNAYGMSFESYVQNSRREIRFAIEHCPKDEAVAIDTSASFLEGCRCKDDEPERIDKEDAPPTTIGYRIEEYSKTILPEGFACFSSTSKFCNRFTLKYIKSDEYSFCCTRQVEEPTGKNGAITFYSILAYKCGRLENCEHTSCSVQHDRIIYFCDKCDRSYKNVNGRCKPQCSLISPETGPNFCFPGNCGSTNLVEDCECDDGFGLDNCITVSRKPNVIDPKVCFNGAGCIDFSFDDSKTAFVALESAAIQVQLQTNFDVHTSPVPGYLEYFPEVLCSISYTIDGGDENRMSCAVDVDGVVREGKTLSRLGDRELKIKVTLTPKARAAEVGGRQYAYIVQDEATMTLYAKIQFHVAPDFVQDLQMSETFATRKDDLSLAWTVSQSTTSSVVAVRPMQKGSNGLLTEMNSTMLSPTVARTQQQQQHRSTATFRAPNSGIFACTVTSTNAAGIEHKLRTFVVYNEQPHIMLDPSLSLVRGSFRQFGPKVDREWITLNTLEISGKMMRSNMVDIASGLVDTTPWDVVNNGILYPDSAEIRDFIAMLNVTVCCLSCPQLAIRCVNTTVSSEAEAIQDVFTVRLQDGPVLGAAYSVAMTALDVFGVERNENMVVWLDDTEPLVTLLEMQSVNNAPVIRLEAVDSDSGLQSAVITVTHKAKTSKKHSIVIPTCAKNSPVCKCTTYSSYCYIASHEILLSDVWSDGVDNGGYDVTATIVNSANLETVVKSTFLLQEDTIKPSRDGLSDGTITGIVLGIIAIIAAGIAIFYHRYRCRLEKPLPSPPVVEAPPSSLDTFFHRLADIEYATDMYPEDPRIVTHDTLNDVVHRFVDFQDYFLEAVTTFSIQDKLIDFRNVITLKEERWQGVNDVLEPPTTEQMQMKSIFENTTSQHNPSDVPRLQNTLMIVGYPIQSDYTMRYEFGQGPYRTPCADLALKSRGTDLETFDIDVKVMGVSQVYYVTKQDYDENGSKLAQKRVRGGYDAHFGTVKYNDTSCSFETARDPENPGRPVLVLRNEPQSGKTTDSDELMIAKLNFRKRPEWQHFLRRFQSRSIECSEAGNLDDASPETQLVKALSRRCSNIAGFTLGAVRGADPVDHLERLFRKFVNQSAAIGGDVKLVVDDHRALGAVLNESNTDGDNVYLVPCFLGCPSEEAAENIAHTGRVNLAKTDPGYFGDGHYFAIEPEYAVKYASGHHRFMVWGLAAISKVKVFNREDYAHPDDMESFSKFYGRPMSEDFDTHYAQVRQTPSVSYQVPVDDVYQYQEIVLREERQFLPLATVALHLRASQQQATTVTP